MSGFLSSIGSIFGGSSLAAEAVKEMPSIVADVYKTVESLIPAAPTSPAEVAVAAVAKKQIPSLTGAVLAAVKTIYGKAVAEYITTSPSADLNSSSVQSAIQSLADTGVSTYASNAGLNLAPMSSTLKMQLLGSALVVFQAGMGLAAISVNKVS